MTDESVEAEAWGNSIASTIPGLRSQLITLKGAYDEQSWEIQRLRRWLRAVSLGRATKDIHAEIRSYLEETS